MNACGTCRGPLHTALFSVLVLAALLGFCGTAFATQTYVSLTFDDSRASQVNAGAILEAHGVNGTFYVNSADVGSGSWNMTLADLGVLRAAGNEIGGHTSNHVDLTRQSFAGLVEEVCGEQQQLQLWGFPAVSFAFPYGNYNADAQSVVRSCRAQGYDVIDYTSARTTGGILCPGCLDAETHPARDPYAIRTPSTTLNTFEGLKAAVLSAEAEGGWLVIPLHSVCAAPASAPLPGYAPDCSGTIYDISYGDLDEFVAWLAARSATGTLIKTVQEVMETPPAPVTGPNLVHNPSLEDDLDGDGEPDGFVLAGYGVNTYEFSRVGSGAHTGVYAERLSISRWTSGDRKVLAGYDLSKAQIPATTGQRYETSVWYSSDHPVLMEAFYHDAAGWHFWEESLYYPASAGWQQIVWRTSRTPAGADYWSFGPALTSEGNLTVDDFNAQLVSDVSPEDTTAPVITVPAPITVAATSPAGAPVSYEVSATDVDDPVASLSCAPPSGSIFPIGTTTVSCTASDSHGNAAAAGFSVTVTDTSTPPAITSIQPGGNLTTTSANISVYYTDGGWGIDPSSVHVLLNGVEITAGCAVTGSYTSCPRTGLPQGLSTVAVSLADRAGRPAYGTGTFFVDSQAPRAVNIQPWTKSRKGSGTLTISAYVIDVAPMWPVAANSGVDPATIAVNLDGARVTGCSLTATTYSSSEVLGYTKTKVPAQLVRCPALSGLSRGDHTIVITAKDMFGNPGSSTLTFNVTR